MYPADVTSVLEMAANFVDLKLDEGKVVVFSKTYCPFCKMAKAALSDAGLTSYVLVELDNRGRPASV